jgi:hypothetical protein
VNSYELVDHGDCWVFMTYDRDVDLTDLGRTGSSKSTPVGAAAVGVLAQVGAHRPRVEGRVMGRFQDGDRVYHRLLDRFGIYRGKHNWSDRESSSFVQFDGDDPDDRLAITTDVWSRSRWRGDERPEGHLVGRRQPGGRRRPCGS